MKPACRFFATPQGCARGAECQYRHDAAAPSGPDRQQLCRFFNTPDGCARGENCFFKHEHAAPAPPAKPKKKKGKGRKGGKHVVNQAPVVAQGPPEEERDLSLPPRMKQWSFGPPTLLRREAELEKLTRDVRFLQVKCPRMRFAGLGRLPLLTKLVIRCKVQDEPVYLEELFKVLAGHPSLTWLDVSGHLVDRPHRGVGMPGSAALAKMVQMTTNLACLRLDDGCIERPSNLALLLASVECSSMIKLSVMNNIEEFSAADLREQMLGESVADVLGEIERAMQNPRLVELSLWPDLENVVAPVEFLGSVTGLVQGLKAFAKIAYFNSFEDFEGSVAEGAIMMDYLENACRWSHARHSLFPWAFSQSGISDVAVGQAQRAFYGGDVPDFAIPCMALSNSAAQSG